MILYPGTKVEKSNLSGEQFINGIFLATNGLVMKQLNEITGVATPAIQNWVARGFIARPQNKRYSKDTTARIFIINLLRKTMPLDKIKDLLTYLNGDPESRDDDIIAESELYSYVCNIIFDETFSFKTVESLIEKTIGKYQSNQKNAKERLGKVLFIICNHYLAGQLLKESTISFNELKKLAL